MKKKFILIILSLTTLIAAIVVSTFFLFKEFKNVYEYAKKYKQKVDYIDERLKIIEFERKKTQLSNNIINYNEINLEINYLKLPNIKDELYKPIGYLETTEENLIFVTGDGQISFLNNKNFYRIDSNLSNYINILRHLENQDKKVEIY